MLAHTVTGDSKRYQDIGTSRAVAKGTLEVSYRTSVGGAASSLAMLSLQGGSDVGKYNYDDIALKQPHTKG